MSQTSNEIRNVVDNWVDEKISNIHTALNGKIISYDASINRAIVQPSGTYKTEDYREFAYPIIYNVPVVFPTGMGGNSGVTFPISSGDGCLIIFAEKQLDDFVNNSNTSDDLRKHSLNDAICIPGLYTNATKSNIKHANSVCLFNGSAMLQITENGFSGILNGTDFKFADGDLVVNGISLLHHTHGNVENGGGSTRRGTIKEGDLLAYDIALNTANNDLVIKNNDLILIDNAERIAQQVLITLRFWLNEWFLDTRQGIPYLEYILVKNPNKNHIKQIFSEKIMNIEGVKEISSMNLDFSMIRRELSINYEINTKYGLITNEVILGYGNNS